MTATGKAPSIFAFMPTAPHYVLDWDGMTNAYKWVLGMKGSTQDPVHHNEGDVWIHTRMVVEQLVNLPQWRAMRTQDQLVTFMAAVLHDVAKPATRKVIEGRIRNPRHSDLGSCDARAILWKMGVPWHLREQVAAIIKVHQVPFWLIESPEHEARRHLIRTSLFVENRLLYLVAQADMLGRRAADQARILDNIALFKVAAEELKCWDTPFPFFNAKTRLEYFYAPGRIDPSAELFDTTSEEFVVTLTSGLPGSGKSTWARDKSTGTGKPVISLDKIRRELGVDPDDNQGTVVQAAKHAMEVLLRNKQSFIFDATNLKKDSRAKWATLALNYGARISCKLFETSFEEQRRQNANRELAVPEAVIDAMLRKWEPPGLDEAHEIEVIVANANLRSASATDERSVTARWVAISPAQ